MDLPSEARAYAQADFSQVNQAFVAALLRHVESAWRATNGVAPRHEARGGAPCAEPQESVNREPYAAVRAVDLGCGPADIPIRLARERLDWSIVAVDGAQAMLDLAREAVERAGLSARIRLVLADAKQSGLPPALYDVVFSNSLLHHVSDPAALWGEIDRLVRPGGFVFVRDLSRPASDAAARAIVQRYAATESALLQEEFHRSLLAAYTPDEVCAQLRAAGLTSLCVEASSDRHLDVWGVIS